jgi:hypothetical protein
MSLDFTVEQRGRHAVVRVEGEPTLAEFIAFIQAVGRDSRTWPVDRALFDLRSVRTLKAFTEHYAIGEEVGRNFGHMDKMASIVPADRITRASQKTARQAGVKLTVFTSEGEAREWLLSDLTDPP